MSQMKGDLSQIKRDMSQMKLYLSQSKIATISWTGEGKRTRIFS